MVADNNMMKTISQSPSEWACKPTIAKFSGNFYTRKEVLAFSKIHHAKFDPFRELRNSAVEKSNDWKQRNHGCTITSLSSNQLLGMGSREVGRRASDLAEQKHLNETNILQSLNRGYSRAELSNSAGEKSEDWKQRNRGRMITSLSSNQLLGKSP